MSEVNILRGSFSKINLTVSKNEPVSNIPAENNPKIEADSLKVSNTSKNSNTIRKLPANTLVLTDTASIKTLKTDNSNYLRYTDLYKRIDSGLLGKITGKEARIAIEILSDDNLRKYANNAQLTRMIKAISYHIDSFKKSEPELAKKAIDGINKTVADAKKDGSIDELMQKIFIDLANTGVMVSNMDDWSSRKIVESDTLLKETSAEQKTILLYALKLGFTEKKEELAINKILKTAVDTGQLKNVLGIWSDGLDVTSSSLDSLFSNLRDGERTAFLDILTEGMKKENISNDVMIELYKGTKVVESIKNLNEARDLENKGKYEEASSKYGAVKDNPRAREMLEMSGYQKYSKNDYLGLVKDFVKYTKYDIKNISNKTADVVLSGKGSIIANTTSSYLGESLDRSFKNFPILQSKNIYELKEKRDSQLSKIAVIRKPHYTEEQKIEMKKEFEAKIDQITGTKARDNNAVSMYIDGEQCFDRLKSGIQDSKKSIYMEAFLFHNDEKGQEIADLLMKKAKEGLDVRVIVDAFSNKKEFLLYNKMEKNGVKIIRNKGSFDNVIESRGLSAYHRKLYIFDQKVALTGGVNIGNEYLTKGKWHDMLVEVQGPAMSDILSDFHKHWNFSAPKDKFTSKVPPPEAFIINNQNELKTDSKNSSVRLITTDPVDKKKNIKEWTLNAINNAKNRVYLQDPYFNDPEIINALKKAVNRGVKVEVILPNANDVSIMKHLGDNTIDELYSEGADTYKYNTGGKESFNHLKAIVVDDYVCLGSANRDVRAMNTNQEINYVIDDKEFTDAFIEKVWKKDKANSSFVEPTPENFLKRLVKLGFKSMPSLF
ncbi:MAG: phosphatidylserine/phosphatidylglycerophosphate/cardiolipin synthase family protein [Candidatus Sericytochromatia bacterium]